MAAAVFTTMSPIKLNTTVLATRDLRWDLATGVDIFRHSGNEHATNAVRRGGVPRFTFQTPWQAAYDLIGFEQLALTAFEVYNATFASFARAATGDRYNLATSATALAAIQGLEEGPNGIIMARVEVVLLSADGTTHPLSGPTGATALPTLASEPSLHIRGPVDLDGTRVDGSESLSGSAGQRINAPILDGDLYPRSAVYDGGTFSINVGHASPKGVIAGLGLEGSVPSTAVNVWLRSVDSNYLTRGANGAKIATATGVVRPVSVEQDVGRVDRSSIEITSISSDGSTAPWAWTASAAIPS